MNAKDVVKYGHEALLKAIENLPEYAWIEGFVTGTWNAKDVVGHIAAYEAVFVEVLKKVLEPAFATPLIDKRLDPNYQFNEEQAALRKNQPYKQVLQEYLDTHEQARQLVEKIPTEKLNQTGTLSWYNLEYSLDDYIVYRNYGHKRHHAAQIKIFRQKNNA